MHLSKTQFLAYGFDMMYRSIEKVGKPDNQKDWEVFEIRISQKKIILLMILFLFLVGFIWMYQVRQIQAL